jgi:uncharacterized Tic20 family protein
LPAGLATWKVFPAHTDEKALGTLPHVLARLVAPFVALLTLWLGRKDQRPHLDTQGRDLLNFQINPYVAALVWFECRFILIGFPMLLGS